MLRVSNELFYHTFLIITLNLYFNYLFVTTSLTKVHLRIKQYKEILLYYLSTTTSMTKINSELNNIKNYHFLIYRRQRR